MCVSNVFSTPAGGAVVAPYLKFQRFLRSAVCFDLGRKLRGRSFAIIPRQTSTVQIMFVCQRSFVCLYFCVAFFRRTTGYKVCDSWSKKDWLHWAFLEGWLSVTLTSIMAVICQNQCSVVRPLSPELFNRWQYILFGMQLNNPIWPPKLQHRELAIKSQQAIDSGQLVTQSALFPEPGNSTLTAWAQTHNKSSPSSARCMMPLLGVIGDIT